MSLLFNMLSRFVIVFHPRSKHLLISWLQSPSAVIWKPKKIKPVTVSPSIYHEVMGLDAMTNIDSILKSSDITLLTKVCLVKTMVFPVVMYGCESWTIKKAERRRIDAFELWCWRRLLRVPWPARRSNQSILKEIIPGCSLEGLMLKLKLQYLATWCKELTHWKTPWCWERLKTGEGDDSRWDGWMESSTQWRWVCTNLGR